MTADQHRLGAEPAPTPPCTAEEHMDARLSSVPCICDQREEAASSMRMLVVAVLLAALVVAVAIGTWWVVR